MCAFTQNAECGSKIEGFEDEKNSKLVEKSNDFFSELLKTCRDLTIIPPLPHINMCVAFVKINREVCNDFPPRKKAKKNQFQMAFPRRNGL